MFNLQNRKSTLKLHELQKGTLNYSEIGILNLLYKAFGLLQDGLEVYCSKGSPKFFYVYISKLQLESKSD